MLPAYFCTVKAVIAQFMIAGNRWMQQTADPEMILVNKADKFTVVDGFEQFCILNAFVSKVAIDIKVII